MALAAKFLFATAERLALERFLARCDEPMKLQNALLQQIVSQNADTAYGTKYRFTEILDLEDYRSTVPLTEYDDLEPYIKASMQGEPKQLTADQPVLYGTTSGTTGPSKYIPVTAASRKLKAKLLRLWVAALYRDHPGIFSGQILAVVSPEDESKAPDGTPCGAESGHGFRNNSRTVQRNYACPYEVFTLKDYNLKYRTIVRLAVEQSVSLLYTCNPSTVLLLCETLESQQESIIRDIRDGVVIRPAEPDIPPELRNTLNGMRRPNQSRANALENLLKNYGGKLRPMDVWPELAAVGCWTGGSAGTYLDKLRTYFPTDIPVRDIGYLATEVRGSLPVEDGVDHGILAVETNFYEFAPSTDDDNKVKPEDLLNVDQLVQGDKYRIFVSTASGLYRYDMHDIVEVVGFVRKTPVIRFVGKSKGIVSFTGEKLSESQVIAAAKDACDGLSQEYEFIAAVGQTDGERPYYTFLIEFQNSPDSSNLTPAVERLDEALKNNNDEYRSKRQSNRLAAPHIAVVRNGEFKRFQDEAMRNGHNDTQFKILKLTADSSFSNNFAIERDVGLVHDG